MPRPQQTPSTKPRASLAAGAVTPRRAGALPTGGCRRVAPAAASAGTDAVGLKPRVFGATLLAVCSGPCVCVCGERAVVRWGCVGAVTQSRVPANWGELFSFYTDFKR